MNFKGNCSAPGGGGGGGEDYKSETWIFNFFSFSGKQHTKCRYCQITSSLSDHYDQIRSLEHFFACFCKENILHKSQAMLLFERSNAFSGEKQCFAPRKAMLGWKAYKITGFEKSVLKVGFTSRIKMPLPVHTLLNKSRISKKIPRKKQ